MNALKVKEKLEQTLLEEISDMFLENRSTSITLDYILDRTNRRILKDNGFLVKTKTCYGKCCCSADCTCNIEQTIVSLPD